MKNLFTLKPAGLFVLIHFGIVQKTVSGWQFFPGLQ
jgi:hypothetical protein